MRLKKLLTLLVAVCVLFAPVVSNASVSVDLPVAHAQDHKTGGHSETVADCHASHDGFHHSDTKVSHGCCFSLVGVLSDIRLIQAAQETAGLIPFNTSLSLASRIEGLYRPPRQHF